MAKVLKCCKMLKKWQVKKKKKQQQVFFIILSIPFTKYRISAYKFLMERNNITSLGSDVNFSFVILTYIFYYPHEVTCTILLFAFMEMRHKVGK